MKRGRRGRPGESKRDYHGRELNCDEQGGRCGSGNRITCLLSIQSLGEVIEKCTRVRENRKRLSRHPNLFDLWIDRQRKKRVTIMTSLSHDNETDEMVRTRRSSGREVVFPLRFQQLSVATAISLGHGVRGIQIEARNTKQERRTCTLCITQAERENK